MSADVLRRAASLMRERAEAATPGPWTEDEILGCACCRAVRWDHRTRVLDASDNDTPHIASWHPAVALAVADWLENSATTIEGLADVGSSVVVPPGCYAVARAYLGESA